MVPYMAGGDGLVDCAGDSARPIAGVTLMLLYLLIVVILLVNLLIALFSKTFDTMTETVDTLIQEQKVNTTILAEALPMIPPPLNLLSLLAKACGLAYKLLCWLRKKCCGLVQAEYLMGQTASVRGARLG